MTSISISSFRKSFPSCVFTEVSVREVLGVLGSSSETDFLLSAYSGVVSTNSRVCPWVM